MSMSRRKVPSAVPEAAGIVTTVDMVDVAVPEVSQREQVRTARANYDERRKRQTIGN